MTEHHKLINKTNSLCPECKNGIPADIIEFEDKVYLIKNCPDHGYTEALLSSDASWYHETMKFNAVLSKPQANKEVDAGCPFDCGACTSHEQKVYLPVIPITSACNLDCPICYTINKNEGAYHISLEEFQVQLDVIREYDPEMKIINLTGGEPTRHPRFIEIVRLCHKAGIHRITISTHGLSLINDDEILQELKDLNARIVLSFDSFDDAVNKKMLGINAFEAKMKVINQLNKYDIDTTLIPVLAKGVNVHELKDLMGLLYKYDCIRSLEIHTMTFTGQGGTGFDHEARITTPDLLKEIEIQSSGKIAVKDFTPSPCAHPMCYQTCYMLKLVNGEYMPFSRFMTKNQIRELLTDNLYMEPGEKMERVLKDVINELWTMDLDNTDIILKSLKSLITEMYPTQPISYEKRQVISERSAKTIYIHSHMDEETFDTDRIRQCCVGVPSSDSTNIPTCAYNILYRERDSHFSQKIPGPINEMSGGKFWTQN